MSWLTTDTPGGVHVIPLGDVISHKESTGCPCGPNTVTLAAPSRVLYLHECGTHHLTRRVWQYVRTVTTHEAMDGRGATG